ncbi:unnamed protein product [Caenorhabditis sp. 36 PRJEB53466]|nr:unnamed protein product [Caenorhabditis sp. 36 PRJEB53466]
MPQIPECVPFFISLLIVLIFVPSAFCDTWVHVNVQKVERKTCPIDETSWGTETTGCAAMSYMTLDERILPHHERRSSSFEYINGVARPTVTHWPKGRLADWMLSIQFISVDPVYGLARTCDRSGYVRVFQNESSETPEFVERTIQIQGQCFVAEVRVQASTEVCPWCVNESKSTTTSTTTESAPTTTIAPSAWFSLDGSNASLLVVTLVLAFFSFLALVATAVLLVVYIIDRRKQDIFEMPPPQANSTILYKSDTAPLGTKSLDRWAEYGSETWSSFQPLDIEATFIPPRETHVYKVSQTDEDYSSDSGLASL